MLARSKICPKKKTLPRNYPAIERVMRTLPSFVKMNHIRGLLAGPPLTDELLTPGEDVTGILDYEEDPEVMVVIANIPCMDDVEMQDVNPPPGFDPEVGWTGYNNNLVRVSGERALGPNSLVTECEERMLDKDDQLKAPGNGRPGSDGNTSRPITNQK